jgi:hypothetical protein
MHHDVGLEQTGYGHQQIASSRHLETSTFTCYEDFVLAAQLLASQRNPRPVGSVYFQNFHKFVRASLVPECSQICLGQFSFKMFISLLQPIYLKDIHKFIRAGFV